MHNLKSGNRTNALQTYLTKIGQIPLLTREQELVLAGQVQNLMQLLAAKESLSKSLKQEPTQLEWASSVCLSQSELAQALKQGQAAKQQMVAANLRLVVAIAKRYQNQGLELIDLIQDGNIGLQRAVEKFDPKRGYRLSTYAYLWIKQGIHRGLVEAKRPIRLPHQISEKLSQLNAVIKQQMQQQGRTPTLVELAQSLSLSNEQVQQLLQLKRTKYLSLDLLVGTEGDTPLHELLEDPEAKNNQENLAINSALRAQIQQLMQAKLKPSEIEVLALRYGLEDGVDRSLAQVGTRMNLSRERVRQLEKKGLEKLRQVSAVLEDFNT